MKKRQIINRELPKVGTKLYRSFKNIQYTAEIVKDNEGSKGRLIELHGERFHTMSVAAKVITRCSVNGWRFWKFVK